MPIRPRCSRVPRARQRLEAERQAYMDRLWADTVGFAAAKMIRRILGLAHNIDLEWIEDKDRRATCEARALTLARDMMVNTGNYPSIAPSPMPPAASRQEMKTLLSSALRSRREGLPARSGNASAIASRLAAITPRSVMRPVT